MREQGKWLMSERLLRRLNTSLDALSFDYPAKTPTIQFLKKLVNENELPRPGGPRAPGPWARRVLRRTPRPEM